MKRSFIILVMVLGISILVNAQKKKSSDDGSSNYKPTTGFSAEVNFNPFNGGNIISINYLKARMFLSESMALRLGLDLNSYSETQNAVFNPGTSSEIVEETKNSFFVFGLHGGIEMHMPGTDRLSPYYGAELGFSMKSASTDITNQGGVEKKTLSCTGIWGDNTNAGYTRFGLNLFVGTDYYIAKHFYIGAEFGFGLQSTSNKDVTVISSLASVSSTSTTPGSSAFNLGANFNSALRLGWSF